MDNENFVLDEGTCYAHGYIVNYSDLSPQGKMSPSAAVNYFQDVATLHSRHAGQPIEKMREDNRGWILLFWHIFFIEAPGEGCAFTAETWSDRHKLSQADRDFCLRTDDGNVFCAASSRWVLMNIERRRPAKLEEDFFHGYQYDITRPCREEDYDMSFANDATIVSEMTFPVMRHNTDTNGHANNAVYVDWAMDSLPSDVYAQQDISEMLVAYKKECRHGDIINSKLYKDGDDYLCILTNDDDADIEFGRIIMKMRTRP